ncbi:MAG: HAMP domain-containing sensor histidine kinase [Myxococcota bacterium]
MRSFRRAAVVAGAYLAVALLYIVFSSRLAALVASSVADLERVETIKGVLFVVTTATALFGVTWLLLRRSEDDAEALVRQRNAILLNDRRVFAGVMASSVAHDANNILTSVLGELALAQDAGEDERREALARLRISVQRLVELQQRLLEAEHRNTRVQLRALRLRDAVRESLQSIHHHDSVRQCTLHIHGADADVTVRGNAVLFHQAFSNLVIIAAEAAGNGGVVEVHIRRGEDHVTLEVHDNGPGVPPEARDGIFSALRTTKPDGTGLGLFSARACVAALQGSLDLVDSPLGGACFRVLLPCVTSQDLGS